MTDVQGGVDLLEREWSRILQDGICSAFKTHITNDTKISDIFSTTSTALLGGDPKQVITQLQTENIMEKLNVEKQPKIQRAIKRAIVKTATELVNDHQRSMTETAAFYVNRIVENYFDDIQTKINTLRVKPNLDENTRKELAKNILILKTRNLDEVYQTFRAMKKSPIEGTDLATILRVLESRGVKK